MAILDKRNILANLNDATLELGCGNRKRSKDSVAIDAIDYECVDIVGDVFEVLKEVRSNSIKEVFSHHFFEHVGDIGRLMAELARILRPNGVLGIVVPHFSNPYFYSDYTHRNSFGLYSFSYFSCDTLLKRSVPKYEKPLEFELCRVDLIFKSSRPHYGRHLFKKVLQTVFNLNRYMREFYEENCCYLFPCYEIHYVLRRNRRSLGIDEKSLF